MKTPQSKEAHLWAYIHGQLPKEERQRLDEDLRSNSHLDLELRDLQSLDGVLRRWLKHPKQTGDLLEDRIMEEIGDPPQQTAKDDAPAGAVRFSPPEKPTARVHFRRVTVSLASAAALLMAFSFYRGQPLDWAPPRYVAPAYRGRDTVPPPPVYSPDVARSVVRSLQESVDAQYSRLTAWQPAAPWHQTRRKWRLHGTFQERMKGEISLEIIASGPQNRDDMAWHRHYRNLQELRARQSELANEIAGTLIAAKKEEQAP